MKIKVLRDINLWNITYWRFTKVHEILHIKILQEILHMYNIAVDLEAYKIYAICEVFACKIVSKRIMG